MDRAYEIGWKDQALERTAEELRRVLGESHRKIDDGTRQILELTIMRLERARNVKAPPVGGGALGSDGPDHRHGDAGPEGREFSTSPATETQHD